MSAGPLHLAALLGAAVWSVSVLTREAAFPRLRANPAQSVSCGGSDVVVEPNITVVQHVHGNCWQARGVGVAAGFFFASSLWTVVALSCWCRPSSRTSTTHAQLPPTPPAPDADRTLVVSDTGKKCKGGTPTHLAVDARSGKSWHGY